MAKQKSTCCYCTWSDACAPDDTPIKCYRDIGDLVFDVTEALNCPDFDFDDTFPKT